ncbi:MAG: glutamate dehydrogenase [Leeuwenhoekiella sp.]
MNTRNLLMVFFVLALAPSTFQAQVTFGFSHEIGVIAGPVAFQSDFGLRNDFKTNRNNLGVGIGIVHYLNFSYRADCNCYTRDTYFNDHFKIRNEIDFHTTNLTHEGHEAEKTSDEGYDLRDHKGKATVFEIGSQLEYYPLSIRDFVARGFPIAPYVSLGAHFVGFKPEYSSIQDVPGATPQDIYYDPFLVGDGKLGGIDDSSGSTWALTTSVGFRFKLTTLSDLNFDLRYHKYFSNWVDGLNPDMESYPPNRNDDSIVWFNIGYIYYLDF